MCRNAAMTSAQQSSEGAIGEPTPSATSTLARVQAARSKMVVVFACLADEFQPGQS
jgi:hypothetical protein